MEKQERRENGRECQRELISESTYESILITNNRERKREERALSYSRMKGTNKCRKNGGMRKITVLQPS